VDASNDIGRMTTTQQNRVIQKMAISCPKARIGPYSMLLHTRKTATKKEVKMTSI